MLVSGIRDKILASYGAHFASPLSASKAQKSQEHDIPPARLRLQCSSTSKWGLLNTGIKHAQELVEQPKCLIGYLGVQ